MRYSASVPIPRERRRTRRTGVDAAVAYHGGNTDQNLDEAGRVTAPLLMHVGEDDEFISADAQQRIRAAFAGKPNVQIHG